MPNKDYTCDSHGQKCDCEIMHADSIANVKENIVDANDLETMAKLFKVFGDGTRIKLLAALECEEMCVCDLAVTFDKKGKHAYYSLADEHVKEILDVALDHINE